MTLCDNCSKPITGQYVYSEEKNDNKKFCCQKCMYEHYGQKCAKCGKVQGALIEKNGKKFCGTACSDAEVKESVSNFWEKNKGWIIGGGIVLVLLIILGMIFGSKKRS